MTSRRSITAGRAVVWVAIDIAKVTHEVLSEPPNGHLHVLGVPNTRAGVDEFIERLQQFSQPCEAAFEPTGSKTASASGIETPTRTDLARLDRKRPNKGRNTDWLRPPDPDAPISKMKDGRTHLVHKAEHAVDMQTARSSA